MSPLLADLAGKSFLITGASSGIGAATARLLGRAGAQLTLTARRADLLENVAAEVRAAGGQAWACPADITVEAEHTRLVDAAVAQFGRLDGAFNNAGVLGRAGPLHTLSTADFAEVMLANVQAMFWAMKAQIPVLRAQGGGAIVNTASVVAQVGFANSAIYTASKHAVLGLTRSAALENFAHGVRINADHRSQSRSHAAHDAASSRGQFTVTTLALRRTSTRIARDTGGELVSVAGSCSTGGGRFSATNSFRGAGNRESACSRIQR